jgi:hypothetical protein
MLAHQKKKEKEDKIFQDDLQKKIKNLFALT